LGGGSEVILGGGHISLWRWQLDFPKRSQENALEGSENKDNLGDQPQGTGGHKEEGCCKRYSLRSLRNPKEKGRDSWTHGAKRRRRERDGCHWHLHKKGESEKKQAWKKETIISLKKVERAWKSGATAKASYEYADKETGEKES